MCLAVPAEVKSIEGVTAEVDFGGVTRPVNLSLVTAKIGDYVIVHAGYAIEVLDREEAEKTLQLFRELLTQDDFEGEIVPSTLFWINALIARSDWQQAKRELPESFLQRRIIKTDYKTLQRIRRQRKAHRLPEWHAFLDALDDQLAVPEFLR